MALAAVVLLLVVTARTVLADNLSFDERVEIMRGLTSEYARSKVILPRSKKPLVFHSDGQFDKEKWQAALLDNGPAARVGDQIQITRVLIEDKKILLEINNGLKNGRHWYDHVEVGMGGGVSPVGRNQNVQSSGGSSIVLVFKDSVPSLSSADLKQMLSPLFDFSKDHSAIQNVWDTLPEPVKKAIKEQKAINGMTREQVMLAMGRPRNKSRESKDGDETEDWVYGDPPGKMTFVTFSEGKVIQVRENYANVGGYTAAPLPPQ